MADEQRQYVNVTIPKQFGQGDTAQSTMRKFLTKDSKSYVEFTLPPHTEVALPNGEVSDVSFYKFIVPERSVREWENDPKNVSIGMPVANNHGEPWMVRLRQEQGSWEHPEAEGDERGAWVSFGTTEISLESTNFANDMQKMRDERKAWAVEHSEKAPSVKDVGKEASESASQIAKETKQKAAKGKEAQVK